MFASKADADAYLAKQRTDIHEGTWISPQAGRLTVKELGDEWLASDPSKRSSTRSRDESILRLGIYPTLEKVRIENVTKPRVQSLVNAWVEAGKAPRTVQRQYDVLRAVFTYAVENDRLLRSPCRGIKEPEADLPTHRQLSGDDVAALADEMPDEYRPMVYLGAILGLRWGEVAGLSVGALDLGHSLLTVAQQLGRDRILAAPKSHAGLRTVTMPAQLTELLSAHLEAFGLNDSAALIFSAPGGGPLDYTNWRRRAWLPAATAAGLAGIGFHDLRRAAATALVRLGVDVKTAQARLGHSDPRLTLAVYAQATSEGDQDAARRLGERFAGPLTHARRTPRGTGAK